MLAWLLEQKKIYVREYRRSKRFGIEIPVYSLEMPAKAHKPDLNPILGGVTSERLVEYDFVSRHLVPPEERARILDVGAAQTKLDASLREYGGNKWEIIGIDIEDGCDVRMDARQMALRDELFDQVICISTIEHIGFDHTGFADKFGDKRAIQEIHRVLKRNGLLLLTVPYGAPTRPRHSTKSMQTRVYCRKTLGDLIDGFSIKVQEYYRYNSGRWQKCNRTAAEKLKMGEDPAGPDVPLGFHSAACTCLLLKRMKNKNRCQT